MAVPAQPTIAVDAVGGDHAPREIVRGAVLAAVELGTPILLVGPAGSLPADDRLPEQVRIVPSGSVVDADELPLRTLRRRRDASILVACEQVRSGRAGAIVSAGSSGATVGAASTVLGRLPGVKRPAIASVLPATGTRSARVLLDAGANPDCKPEWLVSFARLGAEYARSHLGVAQPRVGLLNTGTEDHKGSELARRAHELLAAAADVDFCGNVEGYGLFSGPADVVVTDGFTGNVALKVAESAADMALRARPAPSSEDGEDHGGVADRVGGSLLLGVDGTVVVAHGAARAEAVRSAIRLAARTCQRGVVRPASPDGDGRGVRGHLPGAEHLRGFRRAR